MIFKVRFLIEVSRTVRLHSHHAGVIHALISNAWGAANRIDSIMPDGCLLEAPEQCRNMLFSGEAYAFGVTLIDESPRESANRISLLAKGLKQVGRRSPQPRVALGGNFRLQKTEDLFAGKTLRDGQLPVALPTAIVHQACQQLAGCEELTLRFVSPFLAERPKKLRRDGHQFFDNQWFGGPTFLRRLADRLHALELADERTLTFSDIDAGDNRLVWLDFSYGPKERRKPKHGAVGTVRLTNLPPAAVRVLVLGQHARVGGALRFGFGNYRIVELGADPFACERTLPLCEQLFRPAVVDRVAQDFDLPSGVLRQAVGRILDGNYQPDPVHQFYIETKNDRRRLSLPSQQDRALQRIVLDGIGPAIDKFLEDSSIAYRRGLGIKQAAGRLKKAVATGYQWALKADFRDFFESIDHAELERRLKAYLADDDLVELLMKWVCTEATPDRGLPTGAVLSPLLANIFLDRFDESVSAAGGYLVRYADDFLVLYRDRDSVDKAWGKISELARQFCLELNQEKTRVIDLRKSFEFLGLRFYYQDAWNWLEEPGPIPIRELGWERQRKSLPPEDLIRLPGESAVKQHGATVVICGPDVRRVNAQGKKLIVSYENANADRSLPLEQLQNLIFIGVPDLTRRALTAMNEHSIRWSMIDDFGEAEGTFEVNIPIASEKTLMAQFKAHSDSQWSLKISRQLVEAKLRNYAALARAWPGRRHDHSSARDMERLAKKAASAGTSATIQTLLGIEGAGAAAWYGQFAGRIRGGFKFERRVAPGATDPINALLNAGQTVLHHLTVHLIRQVGMAPSVGFLHAPRAGHASLASDLQEPFRHLVDRVVIEVAGYLKMHDFEMDRNTGMMRIKPRAMKQFLKKLHEIFQLNCQGQNQSMPKPYRMQMLSQIRSLRRHLIDPDQYQFEPFVHP